MSVEILYPGIVENYSVQHAPIEPGMFGGERATGARQTNKRYSPTRHF
ncbi:hypothetical protein [Rhodoferax ferrireducens]|nr:hypothetical protein [Rhodoferax ferrireducens]